MASDLAALGFSVNSKPLADATNELNKLSAAADRAENANDNLAKSADKTANATKKAAKDAKDYSDAIKGSSFQTANLASQFNDIGVMLAAGQSPIQLALQQGTQISQVLSTMGSGTQVLKGLAAAFMSVVSPVSLVTVGIIAAGAALVQYVTGVGNDIKSADDVLKGHEALIREVRDAYGDAAVAVEQYAGKSKSLLEYDIRQKIDEYKQIVNESAQSLYGTLQQVPASTFEGATYTIGQVQAAMAKLQESIKSGNPDIRGFIDRLIEIENQSGTPEQVRELIREIVESGRVSVDAQGKLASLSNIIENLGDSASNQVGKINDLTKAYRDLASIAAPTLSNMEQAQDAYNRAVTADGSIENRIKAAKEYQATLARLRASEMPVPGQRPNLESIAPEKEKKATRTDAEREADRQAKAISRVTENLQFELDTMGMSAQSMRLQNALRQAGVDLYSEEGQKISDLVEQINRKEAATKAAADADKQAKEAQEKFQQSLNYGFDMISDTIGSIADGSEKASDAVKKLALQLAFAAAQGALLGTGPLAGLFGGGLFGGGGGWNSSLTSMVGPSSIGLFAGGGVTNKPAIFGEAGPEAAVPLPDGRRIPVDLRGTDLSSSGGSQGLHITLGWSRTADGNLKPYIEEVAQQTAGPMVSQGITQYDSQVLPGRVNQISQDPRAVGA